MLLKQYQVAGCGKRVFSFGGVLDSYKDLERIFAGALDGVDGIVVDLSQTEGVRYKSILMLNAERIECLDKNKTLVLCGVSHELKITLKRLGILESFTIVPDLAAALALA